MLAIPLIRTDDETRLTPIERTTIACEQIITALMMQGTLNDPGIWPEATSGRKSGSLPVKRGLSRASTTCSAAICAETVGLLTRTSPPVAAAARPCGAMIGRRKRVRTRP